MVGQRPRPIYGRFFLSAPNHLPEFIRNSGLCIEPGRGFVKAHLPANFFHNKCHAIVIRSARFHLTIRYAGCTIHRNSNVYRQMNRIPPGSFLAAGRKKMRGSPPSRHTFAEAPMGFKQKKERLPRTGSKSKKTREALRESEEWQKTILQTAMDGFWMADTVGRLLGVNQTYCRMSGYSEQELLNMNISDLECSESKTDTLDHIRGIIAKGEERFESCHRRKNGSFFHVEISVQYRPLNGGRLCAFLRDITERKQVENELRDHKEKFETIFNSTIDGILIADIFTKKILQGNPAICAMLGYSRDELDKLAIDDIHPPESLAGVLEEFEKQIKREKALAEDIPVLRKDGSIFYADIASAPATIGGKGYLVGIFRDITERKRSEEKLKAGKNFLDAVLDNSTDSLLVIDTGNHSILRANKTFLDSCGLSTAKGLNCCALFHDRSTPYFSQNDICPLEETVRTGRQSTIEHVHKDKSGAKRHVVVTAVPIKNKKGEIRQIIHLSRDITDRKQAEQALRQQREELALVSRLATVGEFAASIAHEIHQPLAAILNNARAAQRFLSSGAANALEEVRDALKDIVDDDRRAAEVIEHLRSFMRRKEAERSILDINLIIEDVLTILRGELIDRHVYVKTDMSHGIPPVEGNSTGLQQVLMNLILNGCDSLLQVAPQMRKMVIKTAAGGQSDIIVSVRDSGKGFAAGQAERVFDHFYTTKPEGLGMGLSISKSIITAHGGRIWAADNPEGGATFFFALPVHKTETVPS
jgi:PAS domain S-box-containing protein